MSVPSEKDPGGRWSVWLVAAAAAAVSLPGLTMPFLSDDWTQLRVAAEGFSVRTPFGDFRPVFMVSHTLDWRIWGTSAAGFHATNAILIACAAALVTTIVRRYTADPRVSTVAGLLFALHPYHVEPAAWIGGRSDPLFTIPFLLAALAYDRWRDGLRRIPVAALALHELALLAKESALSLPPLLILIGILDRKRRPGRAEWTRGYLPMIGVTALHFLVLRTWVLGGPGRTLHEGFGLGWVRNALGYAAASVLPLQTEILASRPWVWGTLACALLIGLAALARARRGALPPLALASAAAFALLLAPYVVGFQERYLFLPSAASALGLAALLRAVGGRTSAVILTLIAVGWLSVSASHWNGWREAAIASESLVSGLTQASRDPEVGEIVVANMPHHVGGGSVAGDFRAALEILGERAVPVMAAAYVSYPAAAASSLDGPPESAVSRLADGAEVRLRVSGGPFSSFPGPRPEPGRSEITTRAGTLRIEPDGRLAIRVSAAPERGRVALVWIGGKLERLF